MCVISTNQISDRSHGKEIAWISEGTKTPDPLTVSQELWLQYTKCTEYKPTRTKVTMLSLVSVVTFFLACLPPETVSQQCRSGVTDQIRQSVREQLRQGGGNGTIPTVAVNCGQVYSVA